MTLFGKRKKEETKVSAYACNGACEAAEVLEAKHDSCPQGKAGICCLKVLGAGCKRCHEQYEHAKAAAKSMGLSVEVEYITELSRVAEYGVMSMPALVVNDKVVSMGKVLKAAEVEELFHKLLE